MTRSSRCAWPIALALAAGPSAAFAEPFACYPIQRGDNTSRLAQRITGSASNKYQPWFDIVDVAGRSVPKSQYDRIRSGWRACVPERVNGRRLDVSQVATNTTARPVELAASLPRSANAPRMSPEVLRPSLTLRPILNL